MVEGKKKGSACFFRWIDVLVDTKGILIEWIPIVDGEGQGWASPGGGDE